MHDHGHDTMSEHSSEDAWNQWVKSMKNEMESGVSPQSAKVKKLMGHWGEMVMHLSGGDEKRQNAFNELMHNEPQARRDHGIDDALFEFMSKV